MAENVFILGLDNRNSELLRRTPGSSAYRLYPLLSRDELMCGEVSLSAVVGQARTLLEAFDGSVDAITGYLDFPISSMVPILSERFGTRSASLRSVMKCEHKYWSRLEQRKVTREYPPFALVDLRPPSLPPPGVRYPMWLKPVKAYRSELAFRVRGSSEFAMAAVKIRKGIGRVGKPFDEALALSDPPREIAEIGGQVCLAEEEMTGKQVTVEGYCYQGRPYVYGLVDSLTYPGSSSFQRYRYPSELPTDVARRMVDVSTGVVRQIGLDSTAFNVEFFWDQSNDRICLLEINPRLSASHAPLFEYVDGVSSYHRMLRLALGWPPEPPPRRGAYRTAAKWFLRHFSDAVVRRRPTQDDLEAIQRAVPGVTPCVSVDEGCRLSELEGQDSYSYELGHIFIGANSDAELIEKYRRCLRLLPFEFGT